MFDITLYTSTLPSNCSTFVALTYRTVIINRTIFTVLTDPVNQSYEEEGENEKIMPFAMATTSAAMTPTNAAIHYTVATTTSMNPRHRNPAVVEIDLLHQGYSLLYSLITSAVDCSLVMLKPRSLKHPSQTF